MRFKALFSLILLLLLNGPTQAKEASAPPQLSLSVEDAILMALEHNPALKVEKLELALSQTRETEAAAVFDSRLTSQIELGANNVPRTLGNSPEFIDILSFNDDISVNLEQAWATGSRLTWQFSTGFAGRSWADRNTEQQVIRLGATFTQALLQGRDPGVNLAQLKQAERNTEISAYKLRGFAEALVAQTEQAYWDYLLARQELDLTSQALQLAQIQLEETQQRIAVGKLPGVEAIAAEAEVALRKQAQIDAETQEAKARLTLLRLLNPDTRWADYQLTPAAPLIIPAVPLDAAPIHVALALKTRPEMLQTALELENQTLEIQRTRDGLLPRLDLFLSLGKTGYASAFIESVANLPGNGFDSSGGLQFSYPLGVRQESAQLKRAELSQTQQEEALHNLKQLIELDVRQAHMEVTQARQQIEASKISLKLQRNKLKIETEKYRVGKSTAFQVAQAQRDLLQAEVAKVRSLLTYMKRLTTLYRLEGTLLKRRGIQL